MKIPLILTLLLLAAAMAHAQPIDYPRLADAIAHKETGLGWDGRYGPTGELSRYQITRGVWEQHSREPFSECRNEAKARAVALLHLQWLASMIERVGVEVTPERLATTWHYGWTHRRTASEWGRMVEGLYNE